MKAHRFAEFFPLLEGPSFDALTADIATHGQRDPVVLFDGTILDGRNRWRACEAANITPETTTFHGSEEEALALVISTNLHRRHLDESQRAMVAARIANLRHGERVDRSIDLSRAVSQPAAAEQCNVSVPSLKRAAVVIAHGAPELVHAVETGNVAVSAAAEVARLPQDEQRAVVAQGGNAVASRAKAERSKAAASASPLTSAMSGAPPVALMPTTNMFAPPSANDDGGDEVDDPDLGEPDETPDPRNVVHAPGWRPPLTQTIDGLDVDMAAASMGQLCSRFSESLRAAYGAMPEHTRDAATRRIKDHLLGVVAVVVEIAPHLRESDGPKATLRIVK